MNYKKMVLTVAVGALSVTMTAQTAAEGKHHGAVACAKLGTDGIPLLCLCEHLRAHRVAHHDGGVGSYYCAIHSFGV